MKNRYYDNDYKQFGGESSHYIADDICDMRALLVVYDQVS